MRRTRWWNLLVGVAALDVLWSLAGVLSGERITVGPAELWAVLGGAVLLLTPVFYLALYRETTSARDGCGPWTPAPRVWVGGGALLSLVGTVAFLNPMTHYVAALYLVQRARKSTPPDPVGRAD